MCQRRGCPFAVTLKSYCCTLCNNLMTYEVVPNHCVQNESALLTNRWGRALEMTHSPCCRAEVQPAVAEVPA